MTNSELKAIVGKSESEIQKEIIAYLEKLNYIVIRHNAGYIKNNVRLSPVYTPDLQVIMYNSKIVWIEVKKPGKDLSEGQRKMKANLENRGQIVLVARSVNDVKMGLDGKEKKPTNPGKS